MILDAFLAFGVAMSYATQLTIPRLPFGYSELFLLLWIVLSIGRILAGGRLAATQALTQLARFWLVLTLALAVGTIVGYLSTVLFLDGLLHDTFAYVLLVSITCLAAAEPDADRHLRRSGWWIIVIANAGFAIQLGLGWGWIHQSGVDPWFWDRFRGWSDNPNQLALYCALFGPLALHLATTTSSRWGRFLGLSSLILTFYVGRLTKSDTYLYTTILTCLNRRFNDGWVRSAGDVHGALCSYRGRQCRKFRQEPHQGQRRGRDRGECGAAPLPLERSTGEGRGIWVARPWSRSTP